MDADFMFKYQPVYDPRKKKLVPLTEINEDDENYKKFWELISLNNLSEEQVNNLAYGNLDPFSLLKLDDWKPSPHSTTSVSIIMNTKILRCQMNCNYWADHDVEKWH